MPEKLKEESMSIYSLYTHNQESLRCEHSDLLILISSTEHKGSLSELLRGEDNLFTPTLITNAVENLCPFKAITIEPIDTQTHQTPKTLFSQGAKMAHSYEIRGNSLILGTISAALAPSQIQKLTKTIESLSTQREGSAFELLEECDAMLLYISGFLFEASRRFHLILGGDILMAFALLVADSLREELLMRPMHQNISYVTTEWALQTQPIEEKLAMLSYEPHALYSSFSCEGCEIKELEDIGKNGSLESAASGAALAYAEANNITQKALLEEMELIVYML